MEVFQPSKIVKPPFFFAQNSKLSDSSPVQKLRKLTEGCHTEQVMAGRKLSKTTLFEQPCCSLNE